MPFQIPTLPELVQRTANAFRANLKGTDARLWPNNVAVAAKVKAGAVFPAYRFIEYISRQAFAHLADGPFLERKAYDYGLSRLPATYAAGMVTFSGDSGVVVPAGVTVQRVDGVRYETIQSGTISTTSLGTGTADVPVRALEPGRAGNAPSGAGVTLLSPLDRIRSDGAVGTDGIGLGADEESDEGLRSRLLQRLRYPPHGGAAFDYVAWAREVNGVTRVFVDPVTATNGRVSVGVWFMMDDLRPNGIPLPADVAAVAAHIDGVRPAGALVQVMAPAALAIPVTVQGLDPDTLAVRDAIRAELADLFRRIGKVATSVAPVTLHRSKIDEAVSIAAGEDSHTLAAPLVDTPIAIGVVPVLGAVSFTSAPSSPPGGIAGGFVFG